MAVTQRVLITADPFEHLNAGLGWNKKGIWPCKWVVCADAGAAPFVTAYRCRFDLPDDDTLRVHVTADERYELFLDGQRVGRGSERGDADHWFFETYDLDLTAGLHVLAARVWSLGTQAPYAQMTLRPGFLLAPQTEAYQSLVGTGQAAWEAKRLNGCAFLDPLQAWGTGANVVVDGSRFDWDFESGEGGDWQPVLVGENASTARRNDRPLVPLLEPATLPAMHSQPWTRGIVRHLSTLPIAAISAIVSPDGQPLRYTCDLPIRQADHLDDEAAQWTDLLNGKALTLPPYTARRVVLDMEDYVCAYPRLIVSGGAGGVIRVHWQESLFDGPEARSKGNRDDIEGKYFTTIWSRRDGIGDAFLPDGGAERLFETLWWQCGRYVEIVVQTQDTPLTLHSLAFDESRYPLEPQSRFDCSDPRLAQATPLMIRALQMCSHETYMDCPYYEQLMYVGDTRLEALATYALTRDTRLPRKALRLFGLSRRLDGLTQSRYPTRVFQSIPPFSLWWVGMLHDYARWRDDPDTVRELLPGARGVIDHFARLIDADGLLHAPDGWNFMDWVGGWKDGTPPGGHAGVSGPLTWQFALVLRLQSELETYAGEPELAARARRLASQVTKRAEVAFWNEERGLFADDLEQQHFSEHAQCLALLGGIVGGERQARIAQALLGEARPGSDGNDNRSSENAATPDTTDRNNVTPQPAPDMARTTIYFNHYLFETYHLLNRTDKILDRMGLWFDLAAQGLKTTVEMPEPTRSDCHAWGAHPLYHYFASILGIRPAAMGFRTVRIAPDLGSLTHASGTFPHPKGDIVVELRRGEAGLEGYIVLPDGLRGTFEQNKTLLALKAGRNPIGIGVN